MVSTFPPPRLSSPKKLLNLFSARYFCPSLYFPHPPQFLGVIPLVSAHSFASSPLCISLLLPVLLPFSLCLSCVFFYRIFIFHLFEFHLPSPASHCTLCPSIIFIMISLKLAFQLSCNIKFVI